ncbi:MAG TPA: type II toxin-antitoxin system VapC family toxin [Terriglobales bacterium]|nr:type II toxin-antitoxin system VapC family toxin [Terriglobales bacterium]
MSKTYVLDANAVLDFVESGAGSQKVERLLHEALRQQSLALVSVMNWGEVFYLLWQRRGEEKARQTIASLSPFPLEIVPVDLLQALKAAEIKALHKMAYVDCVAAALAELRGAVLVTSDRDFEKLGRRVQVLWLPRP